RDRRRSASADFRWSMCATMLKLRTRSGGIIGGSLAEAPSAVTIRRMRRGIGVRQPLPWEAPGGNQAVEAWVDTRLEQLGMRRTGPMEPRPRPWSIVLTVPTSNGGCYFK